MEKESTIYVKITKSYASSATEYKSVYKFEGVTNLLGFLNDSIEHNDGIFTGLTFNDPGDEKWEIVIGLDSARVSPYHFEIKTWSDINLFIKGLLVAASFKWSKSSDD